MTHRHGLSFGDAVNVNELRQNDLDLVLGQEFFGLCKCGHDCPSIAWKVSGKRAAIPMVSPDRSHTISRRVSKRYSPYDGGTQISNARRASFIGLALARSRPTVCEDSIERAFAGVWSDSVIVSVFRANEIRSNPPYW